MIVDVMQICGARGEGGHRLARDCLSATRSTWMVTGPSAERRNLPAQTTAWGVGGGGRLFDLFLLCGRRHGNDHVAHFELAVPLPLELTSTTFGCLSPG